jgi:small nuclear ribonucleoprotein (snRNP)-like protein
MMNDIMRGLLHDFVTVYLDDGCVYSHTLEEYFEHMRLVLRCFKEEGLNFSRKEMLLRSSKDAILTLHCVGRQDFSSDQESR